MVLVIVFLALVTLTALFAGPVRKQWQRQIAMIESSLPQLDKDAVQTDWASWFTEQNGQWSAIPDPRLSTRWYDEVPEDCPLPDYPRPQMQRQRWQNLNGIWNFNVLPAAQDATDFYATDFPGRIRVPFAIESDLSGVARPLLPGERLWYQRNFRTPDDWQGDRILLHFGAVDWACDVFINGQLVGSHEGGDTAFHFDITDHLISGDNDLVVKVQDPTDMPGMGGQRGKQSLRPQGIYYTAVSGIWQTVWLEPVSASAHIDHLTITPDAAAGRFDVTVHCDADLLVTIDLFADGNLVDSVTGPANQALDLSPSTPRLWSPDDPFLYDLKVRLGDDDHIASYAGLRDVGVTLAGDGRKRLTLNGEVIFHYGALDQGWWPDGLYTAPNDDALLSDIEAAKAMGLNCLRKHVKVEPARWYYHADRLGILVWQDMPNGGRRWLSLSDLLVFRKPHIWQPDWPFARFMHGRNKRSRARFEIELREMISQFRNHPSIVMWVPFNEGWGQFSTKRMARMVKALDPTRTVNAVSGWHDRPVGDIRDRHLYTKYLDDNVTLEEDRAFVIGEFGGLSLKETGHIWPQPEGARGHTYTMTDSPDALTDKYVRLMDKRLARTIDLGNAAGIYTQLTDVEAELNGFMTYDRHMKMDTDAIRAAHQRLYDRSDHICQ